MYFWINVNHLFEDVKLKKKYSYDDYNGFNRRWPWLTWYRHEFFPIYSFVNKWIWVSLDTLIKLCIYVSQSINNFDFAIFRGFLFILLDYTKKYLLLFCFYGYKTVGGFILDTHTHTYICIHTHTYMHTHLHTLTHIYTHKQSSISE